jgi:hypothetical protein
VDGSSYEPLTYSDSGFETWLFVGPSNGYQTSLRGLTVSGVTVTASLANFTDRQVIVNFTLVNARDTPAAIFLKCSADICFYGSDSSMTMRALGGGTGFRMASYASPGIEVDFIGRNSPLVADVTTLWYGPLGMDIGEELTMDYLADTDTGMSFSWNRTIPPNAAISLAAMFQIPARDGEPILAVDPIQDGGSELLEITGTVSSPLAGVSHRIIAMIAGSWEFQAIAWDLAPGPFSGSLNLLRFDFADAFRELVFWAVDSNAAVSPAVSVQFERSARPTPIGTTIPASGTISASQSPTATAPPSQSVSVSKSPSLTPTRSQLICHLGRPAGISSS